MGSKTTNINVRTTPIEKQMIDDDAARLGFQTKTGKPKTSAYIRWILEHGQKPIPRPDVMKMIKYNSDIIRLGGLLNQMLYNIHKERKILNSDGRQDENNIHFLKRLDRIEDLLSDILELKKDISKHNKNIIEQESSK